MSQNTIMTRFAANPQPPLPPPDAATLDVMPTPLCRSRNRFPSPQAAAELAEALQRNTHLTELYASGHELDPASVRAIAAAVGANQTLRTLCLGNAGFGDEGTASLAEVTATSSWVSAWVLQVLSNWLSLRAVAALGTACCLSPGSDSTM